MREKSFKLFILSFLFAIVGAISTNSVFAQSNVEIPFNFQVGNERVTAGTYELKRLSPNSFLLRNESGSVKVLVQTPLMLDDKKSASAEKIVFNRYGDKYFLRQIFTDRNTVGRGLYESKSEKMTRLGQKGDVEATKRTKAEQVEVTLKSK